MAGSPIVLGLTALVFCTWAVSLGGIASIQDQCDPEWQTSLGLVNGFSSGLPCSKMFRYQWFIVCLEFVLIIALFIAAATSMYARSRLAWVGLFAVATLLYIDMTNAFMGVWNWADYNGIEGQLKHRINTMLAGCIMTATVNCFLLIAFGISDDDTPKAVSNEKASAV